MVSEFLISFWRFLQLPLQIDMDGKISDGSCESNIPCAILDEIALEGLEGITLSGMTFIYEWFKLIFLLIWFSFSEMD